MLLSHDSKISELLSFSKTLLKKISNIQKNFELENPIKVKKSIPTSDMLIYKIIDVFKFNLGKRCCFLSAQTVCHSFCVLGKSACQEIKTLN